MSIGRCVLKDGDISLPHVVDASITPRIATRGSEVVIELTVDAPLAAPPATALTWGDGGSREARYASNDGLVYRMAYTVGSEESGVFLNLNARILSAAAVPNSFDLPRALLLDFEVPQLVPDTNRIELIAPPGSLQPLPQAATVGTEIRVYFGVTEALRAVTVTAASGSQTRELPCGPPLGTFYTCTTTVAADETVAQGEYRVVAAIADEAGNHANLALGAFVVDTIAPPALGTDSDAIVLERAPHGSRATAGSSRLSVSGRSGTATDDITVVAWSDAGVSAQELARARAATDGSFSFVIPGVDRAQVYVQAVDAAGNAAPLERIRNGVWVATLGDKRFGDELQNPHRMTAETYFQNVRVNAGAEIEPTSVAALDGIYATARPSPKWTRGPIGAQHPEARGGCSMTYDGARGQGVFFGGHLYYYAKGTQSFDDTWVYNGYGWSQRFPARSPSPRAYASFAFDKQHNVTVLFGGCIEGKQCSSTYGDTWTFDGVAWTRVCWPGCETGVECSCTTMPTPRGGAATIWDDLNGEVLIFGGQSSEGLFLDETWSWDGNDWRQQTPAVKPGARAGSRIASSYTTGEVLLVGGLDASTTLTDTWSWNGTTWQPRSATGPNQRMWFDRDSDSFIAYSPNGTTRYEWNGTTWVSTYGDTTTIGTAMGGSDGCGFYEPERRRYVSFASTGSQWQSGMVQDATHIMRSREVREQLYTSPARRGASGMAAIPGAQTVYLIGGHDGRTNQGFSDSWGWDGWSWAQGANLAQPANSFAMATLDATRMIRLGGLVYGRGPIDTQYSTDGTWTMFSGQSSTYPEPFRGETIVNDQAMAYIPGKGTLYFRGASGGVRTWLAAWVTSNPGWSTAGVLWTAKPGATPPSESLHAMASCGSTNGAILFGGFQAGVGYFDTTWRWNDGWTQLAPTRHPSARGGHRMFCDSTRNQIYLVGGRNGTQSFDDVWQWDGTNWTQRTPLERPLPRNAMAMEFQSWRGEGVLFGGIAANDPDGNAVDFLGDTWLWQGGAGTGPAHVYDVSFDEASVWNDSSIRKVDVSWYAGADSMDGGAPRSGATLSIWDRGQWRSLGAQNDAPASAPAELAWSSSTDGEWSTYDAATRERRLRRLFSNDARELMFAASARGTNGTAADGAVVSTDYAEVTVTYRLTD